MSEDLRVELDTYLQSLDIQTDCVLHPPVFTVEEMMPHLQGVSGAVSKNLFLKDKKKKSLWLVSARHDRQVNLNDLAKKLGVGSGNLRFADEAIMMEKLKECQTGPQRAGVAAGFSSNLSRSTADSTHFLVGQGCASALSLLFDRDQSVRFVLDQDLVEGGHQRVYFHPMTNSASMGLKPEDLLRFLEQTGHQPILHCFE